MNGESPYPPGHPCDGSPRHTHFTPAQTKRCQYVAKAIRKGTAAPPPEPRQTCFPGIPATFAF